MLRKNCIKFSRKVSVGIDFVYELLRGSSFDWIYANPLQTVSIHNLSETTPNLTPVAILRHGNEDEVTYPHPKFVMRDFTLETVFWNEEYRWDPAKSDPFTYDAVSNWHISVTLHHKSIGVGNLFGPRKMTVYVGITDVKDHPIVVNSYSILYVDDGSKGHEIILLPRSTKIERHVKRPFSLIR